jgi:hypothetical protein
MGSEFGDGEVGRGGLLGVADQVHASLVGKYGMVFSGVLSSRAAHFLMKTGHLGEELACAEPAPHETHDGVPSLAQEKVEWLMLAQLAHFSIPMQESRVWPYS